MDYKNKALSFDEVKGFITKRNAVNPNTAPIIVPKDLNPQAIDITPIKNLTLPKEDTVPINTGIMSANNYNPNATEEETTPLTFGDLSPEMVDTDTIALNTESMLANHGNPNGDNQYGNDLSFDEIDFSETTTTALNTESMSAPDDNPNGKDDINEVFTYSDLESDIPMQDAEAVNGDKLMSTSYNPSGTEPFGEPVSFAELQIEVLPVTVPDIKGAEAEANKQDEKYVEDGFLNAGGGVSVKVNKIKNLTNANIYLYNSAKKKITNDAKYTVKPNEVIAVSVKAVAGGMYQVYQKATNVIQFIAKADLDANAAAAARLAAAAKAAAAKKVEAAAAAQKKAAASKSANALAAAKVQAAKALAATNAAAKVAAAAAAAKKAAAQKVTAPKKHVFVVNAKTFYVTTPKQLFVKDMKYKVTCIIDTNMVMKVGNKTYYRLISLKGNGAWENRVNATPNLPKYWVLSTDYVVSSEVPKGKFAAMLQAEGMYMDAVNRLGNASTVYDEGDEAVMEEMYEDQVAVDESQIIDDAPQEEVLPEGYDVQEQAIIETPVPAVGESGEYFNNQLNTQPYRLIYDMYYPVDNGDGTRSQVKIEKGNIVWSDAPFVYENIAPEHKRSFPDPNSDQIQRYGWTSVDGTTLKGGLIPMRKDYLEIVNDLNYGNYAEGDGVKPIADIASPTVVVSSIKPKRISCTTCTIMRSTLSAGLGVGAWYLMDKKFKMGGWKAIAAGVVVAAGSYYGIKKTMENI